MFIGHYAPALALAAHPKSPPAWSLFISAQLVDYLFFLFVFPGIETGLPDLTAPSALPFDLQAPLTHSLLGSAAIAVTWGIMFAFIAPADRRPQWAVLSALAVISHWFLDWLVHRPDLPLAPGMEPLGLGLWYHPMIAWPLEIGLLALGTWYFTRAVPERTGRAWILFAILVVSQIVSRTLLPPAESITALAPSALISYTVFAAIAAWALRRPSVPA
ncbi:hypothetical protein [Sandaracinobacteroides hominis]|uniref:hypothetical protein n=1 Tax=Sandaracinobacteroides hominis TaxID=2780086 RepID=UPI0018F46066|nr:hypothetical protein [Sandaracinobacteroides hominis]